MTVAGKGLVGHEGLEAGEAFGGAGLAGAFVGDVFAACHGEEGLFGRGDVGVDGGRGGWLGMGCSPGIRHELGEVPAAQAAVETSGAHLGGADLAGAVHDLPEPDEHFMPGFGHEQEGRAVMVVEFGNAGEAGMQVSDAGLDGRVLDEFAGALLDVFEAVSGMDIGRGDVMAGGAEGSEGFMAGIRECVHGRFLSR